MPSIPGASLNWYAKWAFVVYDETGKAIAGCDKIGNIETNFEMMTIKEGGRAGPVAKVITTYDFTDLELERPATAERTDLRDWYLAQKAGDRTPRLIQVGIQDAAGNELERITFRGCVMKKYLDFQGDRNAESDASKENVTISYTDYSYG